MDTVADISAPQGSTPAEPEFFHTCAGYIRFESVEFPVEGLDFDPDMDTEEPLADAWVVLDRCGRRVPGYPVWASVGEVELDVDDEVQAAIDGALARDVGPDYLGVL